MISLQCECLLCHGAELSAIIRGCPVWAGPNRADHASTHHSVSHHGQNHSGVHEFVIHRALTSDHVTSCHAPCTNRHYARCQPSRPGNLGTFFAGRDAVACTQRLLKRTGFWSASIVRLDLLQAPMSAAGGKTAANQVDRANAVPELRGSRVASQACWAVALT